MSVFCTWSTKSNEKHRKEKKQHRHQEQARKDSNSATGVHTASAKGARKPTARDLSNITCFNYDKKIHYATRCPEPSKDTWKLVAVSATSSLMSGATKKGETEVRIKAAPEHVILQRVPCIRYPVQFWKDPFGVVQALIYSSSKVNAIHPVYAAK